MILEKDGRWWIDEFHSHVVKYEYFWVDPDQPYWTQSIYIWCHLKRHHCAERESALWSLCGLNTQSYTKGCDVNFLKQPPSSISCYACHYPISHYIHIKDLLIFCESTNVNNAELVKTIVIFDFESE